MSAWIKRGFLSLAILGLLAAAPAAAEPFAYVVNTDTENVSVIDTATNSVVATVPVGSHPFGVAVTPDGAFTYATNFFSHNVSVIDTATNTVVATVPVGLQPSGVAVTLDSAFTYVANHFTNNVSVIDTATNTVLATVPVGVNPINVAVTPDGAFAYVANVSSNTVSVIDTATNTVVATVVGLGLQPRGMAFTPDGAFAYVANANSRDVSVIDTATNTVVATVAVGLGPRGVAVTPDGAFVYVTNLGDHTVSVIDTATNTVVVTVTVGTFPTAVAVTPDGTFAYVANGGSNNVSVIDTATNTVVATVPVGGIPRELAITPAPPFPEVIAKTLENGPRVDDGFGMLVDLTGLVTGSNDAGSIDIGRTNSQFYDFILEVTNTGGDGELDSKIISDPIPDLYDLDPLCGDDPIAGSTSCDAVGGGIFVDRDSDTFADGIINDTPAKCTVSSTSGGSIKKGGAGLEPEFVTIVIDDLLAGETCTVRVFVRTDENPATKTAYFEPVACHYPDHGVFDTIPLNEGVKVYDPVTGDRLLGPVGSLQLTPNNCP